MQLSEIKICIFIYEDISSLLFERFLHTSWQPGVRNVSSLPVFVTPHNGHLAMA